MKLRLVEPARGVQWIALGFATLRRQPWTLLGLFLMFSFGSMVIAGLPLVGPVLALALLPTVTLGFMLASRAIHAGQTRIAPTILLAPLGSRARVGLWQLGGLYAVSTLAVMLLADVLDGGRLAQWQREVLEVAQSGSSASSEPAASDTTPVAAESVGWQGGVIGTFLLRLVLSLPIVLAFWHAGALVYWHAVPVGKSLFFSFVACIRNAWAYAAFGAAWGALAGLLMLGLQLLAGAFGGRSAAAAVSIPFAFLLATAFYASLYFSYVDSFEDAVPAEAG